MSPLAKLRKYDPLTIRRLLDPLLFFLLTGSAEDLAKQVQFLKVENEILRRKLPKKILLSDAERRRLLRYGRQVGAALKSLISIVSYRTFLRWVKDADGVVGLVKRKLGRRPTPVDVQQLILQIASDTGWGYTRILGELKKLGIRVSKSTVKKILKAHGYDTGPERGPGTWTDFIQRHAETLWACDFLSAKKWTCRGVVEFYVLFFIHVQTRRVIVTGITEHPNDAWMAQQARNLAIVWGDEPVKPRFLIHDNDTKFTAHFKALLKADDVECVRTQIRSPNMNAYAERFVQTLKTECLDHFVVCGERHLRYLVSRFVKFYNTLRPHQGRDNLTLPEASEADHDTCDDEPVILKFPTAERERPIAAPPPVGKVKRHQFLGGLLSNYERVAA